MVINALALKMTQGCIHMFRKRELQFNTKPYFECVKCGRKHVHNKDCIVVSKFRGMVCKLTGLKICEAQTNYYDEQPSPYVRNTCVKLKIEDYVNALINNMTPDEHKSEYKEDNTKIRKILNSVMNSNNNKIKTHIKTNPAVIALMIVLHYYNMLVEKDVEMTHKDRIKLIKRKQNRSRKLEYIIKINETKSKIVNHRKIWKFFFDIKREYRQICQEMS